MPETNWKPWLRQELEAKGMKVDVPEMPNTEYPIASEWVAMLTGMIGEPTQDTYLIGHSLGCITILRYLESLKENQKIGGTILVAGFGGRFPKYHAGNHDTFFDHELNWQRIRSHCNNFVAIHSDDDPGVNVEQLDLFEDKLGAKILREHGFGHFGSADGIFEIPLVRDELLTIVDRLTE